MRKEGNERTEDTEGKKKTNKERNRLERQRRKDSVKGRGEKENSEEENTEVKERNKERTKGKRGRRKLQEERKEGMKERRKAIMENSGMDRRRHRGQFELISVF